LSNLAVTVIAPSAVTSQAWSAGVPSQAPPQAATVEPASGVAVSVTFVPFRKPPSQSIPQSMPAGSLVTLPRPRPSVSTLMVSLPPLPSVFTSVSTLTRLLFDAAVSVASLVAVKYALAVPVVVGMTTRSTAVEAPLSRSPTSQTTWPAVASPHASGLSETSSAPVGKVTVSFVAAALSGPRFFTLAW
jgi:hypothetical protein